MKCSRIPLPEIPLPIENGSRTRVVNAEVVGFDAERLHACIQPPFGSWLKSLNQFRKIGDAKKRRMA